jgi:murein L,D-transpeptidase YafK
MAASETTRRRLDRRSLVVVAIAALLSCTAFSQTPVQADRVLILKAKRTLLLYHGQQVLKTYRVALGGSPNGPKERQGDHKTPEGAYRIDAKNSKSQFHLALHVSYPNENDRARAKKLGVSPGGDIMIHGLPDKFAYLGKLHTNYDWTEGCIAVSNAEIEEIWKLVPVGTPVEIRP